MKLEFCVLASGSRANASVLKYGDTTLLIDCGLSGKELERRMGDRGMRLDEITAVLITHEHSDHVCGLASFVKRKEIPVYSAAKTLGVLAKYALPNTQALPVGMALTIQGLRVVSFPTSHDAVEPIGFRIETPLGAIGIVTDLGHATTAVRENIRGLRGLLLESNHDPELLKIAPYPLLLKQRIASRRGHLSNEDAGVLLAESMGDQLEFVVAGHVSEKSNYPGLVQEALQPITQKAGVSLTVARQNTPTELFSLNKEPKLRQISAYPLHAPALDL